MAQLTQRGYSVVQRGARTICCTYDNRPVDITVEISRSSYELTVPPGDLVIGTDADQPVG